MRTIIIVAAGTGSRLNLGYNKMMYRYRNKSILEYTVDKFLDIDLFTEIMIVKNKNDQLNFNNEKIKIIDGGSTRQESVTIGIKNSSNDVVYVHDGARPFVQKENIMDLEKSIEENSDILCHVLAVKSKDTINQIENGYIKNILNRDHLYSMQTPQVVHKEIYLDILKNDLNNYSDESTLMFANDYTVKIVEGSYENIKITTEEDLEKYKMKLDDEDV